MAAKEEAFGTGSRISKCLQIGKQKTFKLFFTFTSQPKNFKTIWSCTESTDLILKAQNKNSSGYPPVPLKEKGEDKKKER
jgi:hypothetical protein